MRISIGGLSAKCPGCGAETRYSELILRIGDESMRRAKAKMGSEQHRP